MQEISENNFQELRNDIDQKTLPVFHSVPSIKEVINSKCKSLIVSVYAYNYLHDHFPGSSGSDGCLSRFFKRSTKGTMNPEGAHLLTYDKPCLCTDSHHYPLLRTVLEQLGVHATVVSALHCKHAKLTSGSFG